MTPLDGSGSNPPPLTEAILRACLREGVVAESILGDLREEHEVRAARGRASAHRWYRREALGVAARALRDRLLPGRAARSLDPRRVDGRGTTPNPVRGGRDSMFRVLASDVRLAARSLAKSPRYSAVAVLTLALGVAATTAVFSVVNGVLLRPLDFPGQERLVNVRSTAPGIGYDAFPVSPDLYFLYADEDSVFEDTAIFQARTVSLTGDAEPERVRGATASRTLFSTLGVAPALGRVQSAEEDLPEAAKVAVISFGVWERRFGADPSVVGRTIQVDGETREVIGVMPSGFDYPGEAQLWLPLGMDPASPIPGSFGWNAIGRLRSGVSAERAQSRLVPAVGRLKETLAATPGGDTYIAFLDNGRFAPVVGYMKDDLVGSLVRPLWILLGTVGFVLLIACANVANLVLIRAEGRRRETAVRVAMGATRGSLARHQLSESAVLAGAGGVLGTALAWIAVPLVLSKAPPELPRLADVGIDARVLLFALAATTLSAVLFGAAPLVRHARAGNLDDLRQGGRGNTAGRERMRGRNLLVALQTSLALVLLVGSGLLIRSFGRVASTDLGFDPADRLTFGLALPESRYPTATEAAQLHERMIERLRAIPGVISVGVVSQLPISQSASGTAHVIEGKPTPPGELPPMLHYGWASHGYLETMGIDLIRGRTLNGTDHLDRAGSVVVNETLAARIWPGEDPLGKRLRATGDSTAWYTVVGVVRPVLQDGIREEPQPMIYHPLVGPAGDGPNGYAPRQASYVVHAPNPATLLPAVRAAIWEIDSDLPLADVRTLEEIVSSSVVELSFTMFTLGIAALLALALGGIGLYGVLSYAVARRVQEIGVRLALGARSSEVLGMVVWDGVRVAALGLVAGLAGAAALTRLLDGILFGVEALDPLTFAAMSAVLMAVATLAAYLPARRAARVDPASSMRME
jgi:predicted permease